MKERIMNVARVVYFSNLKRQATAVMVDVRRMVLYDNEGKTVKPE